MAITYATLNPSDKSANLTLSNGDNTTTTTSTFWESARSTIGKSSGKWYWEFTFSSGTEFIIGVANSSATLFRTNIGFDANGWSYYRLSLKFNNNISGAYGANYAIGDVIGVAMDMDTGAVTMYKNNVSQGVMYSGLTGTLYAAISNINNSVCTANFGATALTYSPPAGYNAGLYDGSANTFVPSIMII